MILLCPASLAIGCGFRQGELLYGLGLGRPPQVEAQFRLTPEPILILIDDPGQRLDPPQASQELFDELAQELLRNQAATKIVPRQTIEHLRQSVADFEKRGAREIGELAQAHQVLWIEVAGFLAEEQIEEMAAAAYFSASVRVLNVLERECRARVRLWPESPGGHPVTVTLSGSEAARMRTKAGIAGELARRLAVQIGRLFYDYRPETPPRSG